MTTLMECHSEGGHGEVLCVACADHAGYAAGERTPWTVEEWLLTGDADAEGKPTMGPASCTMCGAGDLAAEARAEQDYRDAQREAR